MKRSGFLCVALCALPVSVYADDSALLQARTVGNMLEQQGVAVNSKALLAPPSQVRVQRAFAPERVVSQPVEGLIVRFAEEGLKNRARQNEALPEEQIVWLQQVAGISLQFVRSMSGDAFVFRFPEEMAWGQAEDIAVRLQQHPEIEKVTLNFRLKPHFRPNDTSFSRQWALAGSQTYGGGTNMEAAWDFTQGADQTVVAILDTGITSHPEYNDRVLPGYDFISDAAMANDGNGRDSDPTDPGDWVSTNECYRGSAAEDSSWHGTHLAGIIAAQGNNGQGIAGVNWFTRILPVRVLGKCGGAVSDIVDAMRWAAGIAVPGVPGNPHPAQIINLSLGMTVPTGCTGTPFEEVVSELRRRNVNIIVAAGNEDEDMAYSVPASCAGVTSVSAVNQNGDITWYSNYNLNGLLSIAAPGGGSSADGIYSTYNTGSRSPGAATYRALIGTSMAAAHVSGVAALAKAEDPGISAELIDSLIKVTSRPFAEDSVCSSYWPACGQGLLDAHNVLSGVRALKPYFLVTEFYNRDVRRYFRTAGTSEAGFVRSGAAGRWEDTGDYFWAWRDGTSGALPVCRFYGTPGSGPESHFYTASARECEQVKQLLGWTYEGIAFYMKVPGADGCPADTIPVYRFYNSERINHRFTTQSDKQAEMLAAGWVYEGVAMCAP